jgi:hypothetical protein
MEVTSIRLERSLKEKLKAMAGDRGYQALIRDILWQYVEHNPDPQGAVLQPEDIYASFAAVATHAQVCALTGQAIQPQEAIHLGLTAQGNLVPLSVAAAMALGETP